MLDVTFDLQVVTPLFMAGSNKREIDVPDYDRRPEEKVTAWEYVPEIRAPSFRGLMRYWLRAAVGGLANTLPVSLEDVRDFEQSIFGATDQGSAVRVRVRTVSQGVQRFRKDGRTQDQMTGKDYLFWSMDKSGKGNNFKPTRYFFTQETKLSVTLSVPGQDADQIRNLECATASLWMLLALGGLGARSRRCAGSLAVSRTSGNTAGLSFAEARDVQELQRLLSQGINEVRRIFTSQWAALKKDAKNVHPTSLEEANFDTLALPGHCRIWILQKRDGDKILSWRNVNDALSDIGQALQVYRRSVRQLEKRASLGLPLIIREQIPDQKLKKALRDHRRASPLLLKVCRLQGGQFVGIAVLFKTQYQPVDDVIPEPEYSLIENWIEKGLSGMQALEVRL